MALDVERWMFPSAWVAVTSWKGRVGTETLQAKWFSLRAPGMLSVGASPVSVRTDVRVWSVC